MLSISPIKNLNYYGDLASEDYYLSGGEPPGKWSGLGSRLLKMKAEVETDNFRAIFRGFTPTGTTLCESAGEDHRPGWDLTFSAPKSVSILWARSDEELRSKIQIGQLKAVETALSFLEQHAAITRRGSGGSKQENVVGLVAAMFEHSTSREQDPHLHTHCLVANVAPRNDGSWGTLESRCFYLWQKAAGAVYRGAFANHLRELGFSIEQSEGELHFEVQGVPEHIRQHFSRRAEAIEAALNDLGISSSASGIGDLLKLTTRTHKHKVDRPALFDKWHREFDEMGFSIKHSKAMQSETSISATQLLPLTNIIERVVETKSVFRLQDLYAIVAEEAQWQGVDLRGIESAVQYVIEHNEVVSLGRDNINNQIFSTPAIIAHEKQLVQVAERLHQKKNYQLTEKIIDKAIKKQTLSQGFPLSDEQSEGVFSVCQSGLDILQGAAGAGKSTSMQAVKLAYESVGFEVIGATIARQAADQLQAETGIRAHTLAKLLQDIERGRINLYNTVLLVDEAGQLPSIELKHLMNAVQNANGKLILVGEQQQMDAITHGGSLRFLSQQHGCARIETIRRQRETWAREAVMNFRSGNAIEALHAHHEHGLVHFADNSNDARDQLVKSWQEFHEKHPEKQTMIIAQRWRDVQPLNSLVRSYYQVQGLVGNENIEVDCTISNKLMRFKFSRGERVRFTRNDYRREFTNGQMGTIRSIERRGDEIYFTINCDDGRTVSFKQSDYCDDKGRLYLAQAYAMTVYASQGTTIDGDVFVYYTTGMDRSASYVAGSRHKDNCHWFFNRQELDSLSGHLDQGLKSNDQVRLKAVAKCMRENRHKSMAIEYLEKQQGNVTELSHSHRESPQAWIVGKVENFMFEPLENRKAFIEM
ncbi:MobF family relaxase [Methylophaga thalassica]|uniref:MobF family relaxase n=1 Tax=Methylophaga thalassica TaxID=40223 RepID=UPI002E7C39D1|nr:MobF family relaxase [Methylophaga thalassica]WVI84922.1 MobF family relaxase [Methylophaga thalassica]